LFFSVKLLVKSFYGVFELPLLVEKRTQTLPKSFKTNLRRKVPTYLI
jgi:hypothetical protein